MSVAIEMPTEGQCFDELIATITAARGKRPA